MNKKINKKISERKCIIKSIKEVFDFETIDNKHEKWTGDGFEINCTEDGHDLKFIFGISNYQKCCEDYGYLTTPDDIEKLNKTFIGSQITDICFDEEPINPSFKEMEDYAVFVIIKTTKGSFQFTAYNDHNGYYGHDVSFFEIKSNDKTDMMYYDYI